MSSEHVREELLSGFLKVEKGLNGERIKNWVSSELENENRGALAAIVFYGACLREIITRGVDDPVQAHLVAVAILSLFGEEDFERVLYYLVGKSLPTKVGEMIDYYKQNLQADTVNSLNTLKNIQVEIGFNEDYNNFDDDEFDSNFDDIDDNTN